MAGAFGMNRQQLHQPLIPAFHRISIIKRLNLRIATTNLRQLFFKLVDQDRIGMLVLLQKIV